MNTVAQEVQYAVRWLANAPGFVAVVMLTLALGIGANAAIFTVVHAVLLRPLPYPGPGRLVTIQHYYPLQGPLESAGLCARLSRISGRHQELRSGRRREGRRSESHGQRRPRTRG